MTEWHVSIDLQQATALGPIDRDGAHRLLLEGDWHPESTRSTDTSLDRVIDGNFDFIDAYADRLASEVERATPDLFPTAGSLAGRSLRYYLVKLIRPIVFFTAGRQLRPLDRVTFYPGDQSSDYASVLQAVTQSLGGIYHETSQSTQQDDVSQLAALPCNRWWRRVAGRLASLIDRSGNLRERDSQPLVMFHGNPARLGPIAKQLVEADVTATAWLVDRFAVRQYLYDRPLGPQLICDASLGRANHIPPVEIPELLVGDVDISQPVARFLEARRQQHGRRWTRLIERTEAYLKRHRPEVLVLDEDITPDGRATATVARRLSIPSVVVQHGVPCSRFGFLPLTADRFLAQDTASADRMTEWGLDAQRILVAGDPDRQTRAILSLIDPSFTFKATNDPPQCISNQTIAAGTDTSLGPRILLLLTRPPNDNRPDAVSLHLTGSTYRTMLAESFKAARRLRASAVFVRPHPRSDNDPALDELVARFADLPIQMATDGSAGSYFDRVDCAISCGSTAGIEASRASLPVVQIVPPTSSSFPSAKSYRLSGTAHDADQIVSILTGETESAAPRPNISTTTSTN